MTSSAKPMPLHRIKRQALWALVAFFAALSYFAGTSLGEKADERSHAVMIRSWTETSIAFGGLIHELQKERGMSSGFVASFGAKFANELAGQYELTDRAADRLRAATQALPLEAEPLARMSRASLDEVEQLATARRRIRDLQLSHDVTVGRYSALIDQMFNRLLATMSVGHAGSMVHRQLGFIFFLQAKEMAGQERALVTAMLANDDFGAARMNAYHRIKAVEQASVDKFVRLTDPDALATFRTIEAQPFVAAAERMRRLIVAVGSSGQALRQVRLPSAERWFDLATSRIDAMGEHERMLGAGLMAGARDLERQAWLALLGNAGIVAVSFLLAGILLLQLWRGKEAAEENLNLAAEVFGNSVDSIVISNADAAIVDVNPAFCRISGYTREEVLGKNPRLFASGRHDSKFYRAMWETLQRTGSWTGEIWNRRKNGSVYPALLSLTAVTNAKAKITHYIATTVDLSKFKETENLLEELRTFDPLTRLPNREAWQAAVDQAVASARHVDGRFAVLDIRLERFKAINESFGHAIGDEVLVAAAAVIKQASRRHDVVARPSGNRFAVLIKNFTEPGEVADYCENLLAAFASPLKTSTQRFSLSISIGVALFPADGGETQALLQNAESALHAAGDGSGGYAFYSSEMNAAGAKLLALEQMMRHALENDEFTVVYQPQIDARQGIVVGVEALLRWHNPELGSISPVQFIPIAESNGLIVPIGEWVLHQACRQAQRWRADFGVDIPVAVNLSAKQFVREDLKATVRQALDGSGLPARLLELEITEGLLMDDPAGAAEIMRRLRDIGLKLALDDFGTGYSSLAYLKSFPFDRLKLDRAFVTDLAENGDDRAIATTVVLLGHRLDMEVLAEGVETEAQRDYLLSIGCDVFQGYLFGKPMSPEDLASAFVAGRLALPRAEHSVAA